MSTQICDRADHPARRHWHYGYGGAHWCTDYGSPLLRQNGEAPGPAYVRAPQDQTDRQGSAGPDRPRHPGERMTTRADLIDTAAQALAPWDGLAPNVRRAQAIAVLDAVLPQITTAEQLDALPLQAVVLHTAGSVWTFAGEQYETEWRKMWRSISGAWVPSATLVSDGPLTVVWQPQPDQETRADA